VETSNENLAPGTFGLYGTLSAQASPSNLESTVRPSMSRTTSTILPPPSDFPTPMPELAPSEPDTGAWRSVLEVTRDTVRPGSLFDFERAEHDTISP
jgi:hypothetical protein